MLWVLAAGVCLSLILGQFQPVSMDFNLAIPQLIQPEWTWSSTLTWHSPILVSLSGQFCRDELIKNQRVSSPGQTHYYHSQYYLWQWPGLVVLPQFWVHYCSTLHRQRCARITRKRYIAGVCNGLFYILGGLFAGSIVMLFSLFPKELIAALAGLALLRFRPT